MCKPQVTIVIPVLNRASYLPRLFESLRAIQYDAWQLILVDNGSEDNSLVLCQQFAADSVIPTRVLHAEQRGANIARNIGLQACTTEYIYFFDSDDEITPDFLDRLAPLVAGNDMITFATRMTVSGKLKQRTQPHLLRVEEQILSAPLSTQSVLWRTEFLREIGGWNEQLSVWQDWELGVRALLHNPHITRYTERAFHIIGVRPDSITGNTGLEERLQAIGHVEQQLVTRKQKQALRYRKSILMGQYKIAGGNLLQRYTRWGGRGAWRIAMWLVKWI